MTQTNYTAFLEQQQIGSGNFEQVRQVACQRVNNGERRPIIIFNDANGKVVDIDYQNPDASIEPPQAHDSAALAKPDASSPQRRVGRPKLGVVAKEVTLLPRHWKWLAAQQGGASVTLRKLVEEARRKNPQAEEIAQARDACYHIINAIGGNEAGSEDALRALYADDRQTFAEIIALWPQDVSRYVSQMSRAAFSSQEA